MYSEYIKNYTTAVKLIEKYAEENDDFSDYLEEYEKKPELNR